MYTFIDLFAGIGGMRLAFEKANCQCVFSSEWDKFAQETYQANFGEKPEGDITQIKNEAIPDHDILLAGFPCQPFSISGVSKKNALGRPHGFADPTQGTLFFEIKRIIKEKKPKAFLLENVKHLKGHDKGNTFKIIIDTLQRELNYTVYYKVISSENYVPQKRQRIYIVGFRNHELFKFPESKIPSKPKIKNILLNKVPEKYTLSDKLWRYLQNYAEKHRQKGNGFSYGLADLEGQSRTLSARYYKDGSEILIPQINKNPRKLTPRECASIMGYPKDFIIPVSDTQAYKQFGNSVVVPLIHDIAKEIVASLNSYNFCNNRLHLYNDQERLCS